MNMRLKQLALGLLLVSSGVSGASAAEANVILASATDVAGRHIVDSRGVALYILAGANGSASDPDCVNECALLWQPVPGDAVSAGHGARIDLIGRVRGRDGATQATYNGHPLFYFAEDVSPGETNGHHFTEFGTRGYLVTPAGGVEGGVRAGNVYARDEACGCG